jgi:hypothetical protein
MSPVAPQVIAAGATSSAYGGATVYSQHCTLPAAEGYRLPLFLPPIIYKEGRRIYGSGTAQIRLRYGGDREEVRRKQGFDTKFAIKMTDDSPQVADSVRYYIPRSPQKPAVCGESVTCGLIVDRMCVPKKVNLF